MEPTWLDKSVWTLFATRTRKRAMVSIVFGCVLVAFSFAYYLYYIYSQESGLATRPYPLFLVFISLVALALIIAGISRLLYDNHRTLARVLEFISIVFLTVFWVFILAGLIYVL